MGFEPDKPHRDARLSLYSAWAGNATNFNVGEVRNPVINYERQSVTDYLCHSLTSYAHTMVKPPDPIRTPKLSTIGPAQYCGGGPRGNRRWCTFLIHHRHKCDNLAEWLRRWPAKPLCYAREGSNPSVVAILQNVSVCKNVKCVRPPRIELGSPRPQRGVLPLNQRRLVMHITNNVIVSENY